MKSLFVGIKNIILWSYERGTWQYDVLCLFIIGTVFLAPSKFFGDRDRPVAKGVKSNTTLVMSGETLREVSITELQSFLQKMNKSELMLNAPNEAITLYLRDQLKQDVVVTRFEPFFNSPTANGRVNGYKVWTK